MSGTSILLPFFEGALEVDLERRTVALEGENADASIAILALHYLAGCDDHLPVGSLAPFNQACGGEAYFPAFRARTIDRLAQGFGDDPARMVKAAARMNGAEERMGSGAAKILIFPKLAVTAIIWLGDDEIPASANLLFDEYALRTMPTEDLAVAGALVVGRLTEKARE